MKEMIKALEFDYIKVFEVNTGVITGKVKFMDYRYRYLGYGLDPNFISTAVALFSKIKTEDDDIR